MAGSDRRCGVLPIDSLCKVSGALSRPISPNFTIPVWSGVSGASGLADAT